MIMALRSVGLSVLMNQSTANGRNATGVRGIRLSGNNDEVVGMIA